jgi:hypothetical protein
LLGRADWVPPRKHCGIYTQDQPRTRPDSIAINVGCIESMYATFRITFAEGF